MSHLTANPFQKHYEFPRPAPLLTPPDTEPEYLTQLPSAGNPSSGLGIDLEPSPSYRSSPAPDVQSTVRKVSSLPYINSGPREARERVVHRGMRWLVVVVPPASFSQEHGHLGHTLAVGSPDRLSQGILMPLCSTMSTQLIAIAREFAFPSTSGLCLYLHTTYSGTTVTPRISDESWSMLWSHLFEPRSPTLQHAQLPIGGKIEFDIDLGKARWYETWIGMARRDHMDVPVSVAPSRPESLAHWRGDSRTTVLDDQTEQHEEPLDILHLGRPPRGSSQRHIPRKLSLLDRFESSSVRSGSKLNPRNHSPPSPAPEPEPQPEIHRPSALSPIIQGGSEPATARKDIDKFVNSWRASATLVASPMAATGQTSLDPANMPNDLPINSPSADADEYSELNLEDFQWSVTSLGPPDYDDEDLQSFRSWRLPSVHLDRRNEGSVCLTPTTCTSFGPPDWDDDYRSYVSYISRLPSPDLAARMIEDCPPTPSTATSWGPPLSYPPSPSAMSYAPSVDIAQRAMSTVPLTPSTATSWGPPMSWPSTPATPYHVHTPDVGERTFELGVPPRRYPRPAPTESAEAEPWRSVWPYNSTAETAEGAAGSPYSFVFPRRPSSPVAFDEVQAEQPSIGETASEVTGPSSFVWPYYNTYKEESAPISIAEIMEDESEPVQEVEVLASRPAQPFSMVWPYFNTYQEDSSSSQARENRPADDIPPPPPPRVRKDSPFRFVFPKDEQPVASTSSPLSTPAPAHSPSWTQVWPLFGQKFAGVDEGKINAEQRLPSVLLCSTRYPYFNIYPSVYPHMELYPEAPGALNAKLATFIRPIQVSLPVVYPVIALYPSVYPQNVYEIYPSVCHGKRVQEQKRANVTSEPSPKQKAVRLDVGYPHIELYSPVYPYSMDCIYPAKSVRVSSGQKAVEIRLTVQYPTLDLYPAVYPYNMDCIYPAKAVRLPSRKEVKEAIEVGLTAQYPTLDLYPAVYPYNMDCIYPAKSLRLSSRKEFAKVRLAAQYPTLDLYPAVYPHNLESIYPPKIGSTAQRSQVTIVHPKVSQSRAVLGYACSYPYLEIYPAVYPWNLESIYPAVASRHTSRAVSHLSSIVVELPIVYPNVQLYKSVYPYNLDFIYPTSSLAPLTTRRVQHTHTQMRTKSIPPRNSVRALHHEQGHHKRGSGSRITMAPPVPPLPQNVQFFAPINPTSHLPLSSGRLGFSPSVRLQMVYPTVCPYPPVYPYFELYPEVLSKTRAEETIDIRLKPSYPVLDIYPAVYPYIEPYPRVTAAQLGALPGGAAPAGAKSVSLPAMRRRPTHSHAELHARVFGEFAPRRKAKLSHSDLHEMVLAEISMSGKFASAQYVEIPPAPATVGSRGRSPSVSLQPLSPRKLPTPPVKVPAAPPAPLQTSLSTPHVPTPSPSPPSSVRRSRSGTVSARPPLPTPPSVPSPSTPSTPPLTPPHADSPSRSVRRLPAPPAEPPLKDSSHPPSRPLSSVHAIGLPSDPAAGRRLSAMVSSKRPPPFAPLPPVPEPDAMDAPAFSAPILRPLPHPSSPEVPRPGVRRSGSLSAGLPPTQSLDSVSELSRAQSFPLRPRRGSVLTAGGGLVAGLAKNYGAVTEEPGVQPISTTLSQFPQPPRPPIPSVPSSRPVSKLDRSRYPFS